MVATEFAIGPVLERIDARLDRMGLAPEDAFKEAGLPTDLLDKIRSGRATIPRGQKLIKLADVLGTSISYLVGLDPDAPPPQELLEEDQGTLGLLARDEEALLHAYRRLDVSSRAAVLHVMLKMAGPEPEPEPKKTTRR
jgi:transcriptional regulator with XRE-family HTH domain